MNFIVSKTMPLKLKKALSKFGDVFDSEKLNTKDDSIAFHPDLQIHFVDCKIAYCEPTLYEYYKKILPPYIDLRRGSKYVGRTYPDNCAYNIARIGNTVICNKDIADKDILAYYNKNNYDIINVKQGYTKCNICKLTDTSIITEDPGIYHTLQKSSLINANYLPVGSVLLDDFDYGFIGGATGTAGKTLLLCGKATMELSAILNDNMIEYFQLTEERLFDYGSILTFE